eukprot:gnl/TRDRNA2_/TRDRNA2_27442_c0_seq1.p1 gnl/TRDRNA2_/TRDRNA2_27442_c0~~gnl/TRDRNA2_/TRDRNA2_27442_c0_seq1.p1  ORF type:complete len:219 (-),score=43.45 gnl/TRDRNA2_/TRDRNA2_27442_c0_seq1:294-950(-)
MAGPASAGGAGPVQKYKVVILGDESTGKTSLITRYMHDTFADKVQATIGMDFQSKTVYVDGRTLRLQLWDTAGQERFRSLIPSYIRDAGAAIVVYDITKRKSFLAISKWMEDVRSERGSDAVLALVGNKIDLEADREVQAEEGKQRADEAGVLFFETSAKAGTNVAAMFQALAAELPGVPVLGAAATAQASAAAGPAVQLSAAPPVDAHRKSSGGCRC